MKNNKIIMFMINGSSDWVDSAVGGHRKLQKNTVDSYYANLIDIGLAYEF